MKATIRPPVQGRPDTDWADAIIFCMDWARMRPETFVLGPMKLLVALRDGFVVDGALGALAPALTARWPELVELSDA